MNFRSIFASNLSPREREIAKMLKEYLSVSYKHIEIYSISLRHKSAARNIHNKPDTSNERLEFLGDAILDAAVADYLFKKYPNLDEGELTKMKSRLVSRINLNKLAEKIGVDQLLETDLQATHSRESLGGNALEALLGAIYIDLGYDKAYRAIIRLFEKHADVINVAYVESDFKSRLFEEAHKKKVDVRFSTRIVGEEQGRKMFFSEVYFDQTIRGSGEGLSKKSAEQLAAKFALSQLNHSEA